MREKALAAAVALALLGGSGCVPYKADIPGVLDLCTDGSGAPPDKAPVELGEA